MNFPLILLLLTLVSGVFWVLDRKTFRPARKRRADAVAAEFERNNREAINRGEKSVIDARNDLFAREMRQPWWLEYTAGLFPVFAVVFLLRSFLFEPFRIPSGSMLPTLHVGDFILVNKFNYGIRLPVINKKVIPLGSPERGDVVVFRYPMNTEIDYIKRVVGVPGDTVEYRNKVLYINGQEQKQTGNRDFVDSNTLRTLDEHDEQLGAVNHMIAISPTRPAGVSETALLKKAPECQYKADGFVCKVPADSYFVMGDNRDNSEDSRYWGFVPDENLVGRATFIWANFGDMGRIGSFR